MGARLPLIAHLDGFKSFNDAHGHAVGDEVLRAFGAALRIAARRTDVVARIGGDEFAIVPQPPPGTGRPRPRLTGQRGRPHATPSAADGPAPARRR